MDFFICKVCKKKFTNSLTLRKHIELKHKKKTTTPTKKAAPTPKIRKNSSIHPALKQMMKEERIRKHREQQLENVNGLETYFMQILNSLKIRYTHQYVFGGKLFDFHLTDYNVLLEVDGDYWHCNPATHGKPKYKQQRMAVRNDKRKNKLCEAAGVTLIRYWENDINNNLEWVIRDLKNKLGLK